MQIKQTLRRYRRSLVASGSPFRLFRKAALYAQSPIGTATRLIRQRELRQKLTPESEQTLATLKRDGFSYAHGELDAALLAELTGTLDSRMAEPGIVENNMMARKFWSQISRPEDLNADSIFVRFALQPNVINLASAYLGLVPYLSNVQVIASVCPDDANHGKWAESQLWHKDYHDTKSFAVWVYLSEVSEIKHGPFTLLTRGHSEQVKNTFIPGRVTDENMEKAGLLQHAKPVYGNRTTPFFIDTASCYHLGSRVAPGEMRVAYLATFNTHAPVYPVHNNIQTNTSLSPLEKLVLKL